MKVDVDQIVICSDKDEDLVSIQIRTPKTETHSGCSIWYMKFSKGAGRHYAETVFPNVPVNEMSGR